MTAKTRDLLSAELTEAVIGSFYDVHRQLGFGFREYIYDLALERDLVAKGHHVEREVSVMVFFRGEPLARHTLDMIIDQKLVIEIKSTEFLRPNATSQLFSYLHATSLELGLLLHFGREPKFYRVLYENRLKLRRT